MVLVDRQLRAAMLMLALTTGAAFAHGGRSKGPESGVAIPNLTHGQMSVIADFSAEIFSLAARIPHPSQDFQRILNYGNIQKTYCAWGLMPGSATDEDSPFNECSHGYLAAAKELLIRMGSDAPGDRRIVSLTNRVDVAMIQNDNALSICQYSEDGFNTASLLKPDWVAIAYHRPSLTGLLAAIFAAVVGTFALIRLLFTGRNKSLLPRSRTTP